MLQMMRDLATLVSSDGMARFNSSQLEMGVTRMHRHFRKSRGDEMSHLHRFMTTMHDTALSVGSNTSHSDGGLYQYQYGAGGWDLQMIPLKGATFTDDLKKRVIGIRPTPIQVNLQHLSVLLDGKGLSEAMKFGCSSCGKLNF